MSVVIRKMEEKDIPTIQDVAQKTWHATYEGLIDREVQDDFLSKAYSDEAMHHRLNNTNIFVAEVGRKVVGFANFTKVNEEGTSRLSAIYIYPEFQGLGIGSKFWEEGLSALNDVKQILVSLEKDNKNAEGFYRSKGFQFVKEYIEDFYGHKLDSIEMIYKVY